MSTTIRNPTFGVIAITPVPSFYELGDEEVLCRRKPFYISPDDLLDSELIKVLKAERCTDLLTECWTGCITWRNSCNQNQYLFDFHARFNHCIVVNIFEMPYRKCHEFLDFGVAVSKRNNWEYNHYHVFLRNSKVAAYSLLFELIHLSLIQYALVSLAKSIIRFRNNLCLVVISIT